MIFLANRANLDGRTLLTRLHTQLQTQVPADDTPVDQVWYHTSAGNKVGVRATIRPSKFLDAPYPVDEATLHVSFDVPPTAEYDYYRIQWIEPEREFMVGWHQDETHPDLGPCHMQLDYRGETVQRAEVEFIDRHPRNVFDRRIDDFVAVLDAISWTNDGPTLPSQAVR
jgi:hypothetical protein